MIARGKPLRVSFRQHFRPTAIFRSIQKTLAFRQNIVLLRSLSSHRKMANIKGTEFALDDRFKDFHGSVATGIKSLWKKFSS
jgi:hypothetical protein